MWNEREKVDKDNSMWNLELNKLEMIVWIRVKSELEFTTYKMWNQTAISVKCEDDFMWNL